MSSVRIEKCPLCGHEESKFHSHSLPNLYSEKIANMTGISEDEIIETHANVSCLNCGLIYKRNWFSSESLDTLFRNYVSTHPKGLDIVSGRFSAKNFFHELGLFKKAIEESDTENRNRYKRALSSIIDSIDGFSETKEGKDILNSIQDENPDHILQYKTLLEESIREPSAFKRFSGFSAPVMWDYIKDKCNGIENYAELGCPLWGLMAHAVKQDVPVTFYQRPEVNYWSENCQNKGLHCSEFMSKHYGIPRKPWSNRPKEKQHIIGFFQYLDHLENPMAFMKEVFDAFEVAAVILDGVDNPLAIQHFTGFTEESLQYIADKFNKTLHSDFEAIKPSGNVLYLFC